MKVRDPLRLALDLGLGLSSNKPGMKKPGMNEWLDAEDLERAVAGRARPEARDEVTRAVQLVEEIRSAAYRETAPAWPPKSEDRSRAIQSRALGRLSYAFPDIAQADLGQALDQALGRHAMKSLSTPAGRARLRRQVQNRKSPPSPPTPDEDEGPNLQRLFRLTFRLRRASTVEERHAILAEELGGMLGESDLPEALLTQWERCWRKGHMWIVGELRRLPPDHRAEGQFDVSAVYSDHDQADAEARRRNKSQPLGPGRRWVAFPLPRSTGAAGSAGRPAGTPPAGPWT